MVNQSVQSHIARLVSYVNRKEWWHVPPTDPLAYTKRGEFLASTYHDAEFYGRPNNVPEKVRIANPFICDKSSIEQELLGKIVSHEGMSIEEIARVDAQIRVVALKRGYDSIILFGEKGHKEFKDSIAKSEMREGEFNELRG